jgi:hypothetical protein
MQNNKFRNFIFSLLFVAGCTPTVKVQAPDKPIEINMNIKIEQEVRVKVEKDLDAAIAADPALFGTTTNTGDTKP